MKKKEKTIRVYRRGTRERKKRSDLHSQEQILIGPERERERERGWKNREIKKIPWEYV